MAVRKKKKAPTIPANKLSGIKRDFISGYPIAQLSSKYDVDEDLLRKHISRTKWGEKRKVQPILREMTQAEKDTWDNIVKMVGDLEEKYRVITFEGLMDKHPEFLDMIDKTIKRYVKLVEDSTTHYLTQQKPGLLMEVVDAIERLNRVFERQFNLVSVLNADSGDGFSPLQIIYNGRHEDENIESET